MTEPRVCVECGAAFVPRDGRRLYCSEKCARRRQRRQCRQNKRLRRKLKHLSPHQRMLANLRQRDALAPKPKIEIINRNGIIIERRGTVPAGCHAADFIRHNA